MNREAIGALSSSTNMKMSQPPVKTPRSTGDKLKPEEANIWDREAIGAKAPVSLTAKMTNSYS